MITELFRPYIRAMIESFEQGLNDNHPDLIRLLTEKLGEQYDRVIGTDHSGCVILETGTVTDRLPDNVVIQALTSHMTSWFGGETIVSVNKETGQTRGFVVNLRELKDSGRSVGFLVHLTPVRVSEHNALTEEANSFLILHSSESRTMETVELQAAKETRERQEIMDHYVEDLPFQKPWPRKETDTNSLLYETRPMPIEGGGPLTAEDEGGPVRTTESLNDR